MEEKLVKILRKASEMFQEFGIRSVSMDDICHEMGMSKKTLYQHVSNKPDLIQKILDYNSQKNFENIKNRINKDMNAIDILITVSLYISDVFKELKPTMNFDLQKYYPDIHKNFINKKRQIVLDEVKTNVSMGIKQGLYRDDLDIELIASLYVQKIKDLHDPDFYQTGKFPFEKVFEVMFENHIRGIANDTGIKYYEEKKKNINFKHNRNE
ncbi:MAG: TetR/AcrR family transcriptional regulator [Chlorobi bacterium]|nr:TetR/AcrR family transcriptional regulator [Chlorobiota bacterium]